MDSTTNGQDERDSNSGDASQDATRTGDGPVNSEPAETVCGEPAPVGAAWMHNKELNFGNLKGYLNTIKEGLEKTIAQQKRELAKMVGARDSLLK